MLRAPAGGENRAIGRAINGEGRSAIPVSAAFQGNSPSATKRVTASAEADGFAKRS